MAENNSLDKSAWQICHDAAQGHIGTHFHFEIKTHLEFPIHSYVAPKDVYLTIQRKEWKFSTLFFGGEKMEKRNHGDALFSVVRDGQGQGGLWCRKLQWLLMF